MTRLRQEHPSWLIGTVWASAASGPDRRRIYATRGGVTLSAWNAAELAMDIRREEAEQARGNRWDEAEPASPPAPHGQPS